MLVSEFLTMFPEFIPFEASNMTETVRVHLANAERNTADITINRSEFVALQAAHSLANTPFGRSAKLSKDTGETTYGARLKERRTEYATLFNRIG